MTVTKTDIHHVVLHGHRLAYRTGGDIDHDKPTLLLIHGLAGSSATWRAVLGPLARHYNVLAPDLFGSGMSDTPRQDYSLGAHANVLRDFLVTMDIPRATIVGQSLGGGIAMQLAYQHPERCERLVLVSSGGLGPEVSWILRALTFPGSEYIMPVLFPAFAREAGNTVSRALARVGIRAPRLAEEWRSYASLSDVDKRYAFVRTLRSVIDLGGQTVSAHDRLYLAQRAPTLIVWGRRDNIIPVDHAHAAHAAIPGSRLVVFEGSGHFPHVEEPDHFVEVVDEFMATTEPMQLAQEEWRDLLTTGPSS